MKSFIFESLWFFKKITNSENNHGEKQTSQTFMFIQMDSAKRKGACLTFPPKTPPPVSVSQPPSPGWTRVGVSTRAALSEFITD